MISSFWYGVFWPYFQFCVFLAFIIYVGRKPIANFLTSKRDEYKTRLSEAHEALALAERKIKKYEAQMSSLSKEIEEIKALHTQEALVEKEKILQDANKTADVILSEAKRASLELVSQIQHELKEDMFKLVLSEFEKQLTKERFVKLEAEFQKEAVRSIFPLSSPNSTASSRDLNAGSN